MFKNSNSPQACERRLSPVLKREPLKPVYHFSPTLPETPRNYSQVTAKYTDPKKRSINKPDRNVGCSTPGWGVTNPNLEQVVSRKNPISHPHVLAYNLGHLRNNLQMETTGLQEGKVDTWLGLPVTYLDSLPLREQRKVVKQRAENLLY